MIDIEELKPILNDILTDENSVDVIERIQAGCNSGGFR